MADYIIITIIGVALFFVIRVIIRNKKKGGCMGCSSCAHERQCNKSIILNNKTKEKSD